MKLAIARACVALGIKQCEKSVLNSLADIMRTYIETIGRYSQEQAEISHRACPGIQDVIPVLEYTVSNYCISARFDVLEWVKGLYKLICERNSCIFYYLHK